jgi:hypothetical protein
MGRVVGCVFFVVDRGNSVRTVASLQRFDIVPKVAGKSLRCAGIAPARKIAWVPGRQNFPPPGQISHPTQTIFLSMRHQGLGIIEINHNSWAGNKGFGVVIAALTCLGINVMRAIFVSERAGRLRVFREMHGVGGKIFHRLGKFILERGFFERPELCGDRFWFFVTSFYVRGCACYGSR